MSFHEKLAAIAGTFAKELFFVGGVPKSGTTWVEQLLDRHPQVLCKGEAHFVSDLRQLILEALHKYNVEMSQKGGSIAHLSQYGGRTDVLEYSEADADFLTTLAIGLMLSKWDTDSAVTCVGEKTPNNIEHVSVLNRYFPSAKFLHVIRDGRDAAVSGWFFAQKTSPEWLLETFGDLNTYAMSFAKLWTYQVPAARKVGRRLGERYREVRYEDLVADTGSVLTGLFEFLGVDRSPSIVDACVRGSAFEALSGGRRAGTEDADSFFRKGIVGDWQNHFDGELAREFDTIAGPLLRELGYA